MIVCIGKPSVCMSLETISARSRSNKFMQQIKNAPIYLTLNLTFQNHISLRSITPPLASANQSQTITNTNLSRSLSLTVLDRNGNELSIQTNQNHSIEIIIPRDPNLVIPSMTLPKVTSFNSSAHYQLFNLHFINITFIRSISLHFEMHPLTTSLGYLFINLIIHLD